jgi:UDP-N-acetylmuramoyl-L-alanyl-D-glutamate--2,6-diaminopimelate ligase
MVPQYLIDYILKTKNVARHHEQVIFGTVYILVSTEQKTSYVQSAINKGAKYAIISRELYSQITFNNIDCIIIPVDNPARFWAYAASLIYPNLPAIITTVTGTSGKTSVAYMYAQAVAILRQKALYIGTLGAIKIEKEPQKIIDTLTTPDILDLRRLLAESQCEYACIEASSHGISQHRIDFIQFKVAAFTNLAPEHLDYHKNMNEYFNAKKQLFTDHNISNLVLNTDDEYSQKLIHICKDKNLLTYGRSGNLQFIQYQPGESFKVNYSGKIYDIECKILGIFNDQKTPFSNGLVSN